MGTCVPCGMLAITLGLNDGQRRRLSVFPGVLITAHSSRPLRGTDPASAASSEGSLRRVGINLAARRDEPMWLDIDQAAFVGKEAVA